MTFELDILIFFIDTNVIKSLIISHSLFFHFFQEGEGIIIIALVTRNPFSKMYLSAFSFGQHIILIDTIKNTPLYVFHIYVTIQQCMVQRDFSSCASEIMLLSSSDLLLWTTLVQPKKKYVGLQTLCVAKYFLRFSQTRYFIPFPVVLLKREEIQRGMRNIP